MAKYDYLSFTLHVDDTELGDISSVRTFINFYLPSSLKLTGSEDATQIVQFPYRRGIVFKGLGISFFWVPIHHTDTNHCMIVLSGTACAKLSTDSMTSYIASIRDRKRFLNITRVDIAQDYLIDLDVFLKKHKPAIKVTGLDDTGTGKTFYFYSKTSDKRLRVYQYNEPHPRHEHTRVEFEFKRKRAVGVHDDILAHGIDSVYAKLAHKVFPSLVDDSGIELTSVYASRGQSGTLLWLMKQVKPAIRRVVASGEISALELIGLLFYDD